MMILYVEETGSHLRLSLIKQNILAILSESVKKKLVQTPYTIYMFLSVYEKK